MPDDHAGSGPADSAGSGTGLPGFATLAADLERIAAAESERARIAAKGAMVRTIAAGIAAALSSVGIALVAVGVYLDRLAAEGPLVAGLVVGLGLVALALIALVPVWVLAYKRARLRARTEAIVARTVASSDLKVLLSGLVPGRGTSPALLAAVALAAGIVAGATSRRR